MSNVGKRNVLTIEKIARELGVSKTTVSRALSGKGRISESTRARVIDFINHSEYPVPISVKYEKTRKTYNLILIIPPDFLKLDIPYFRKSMGGICSFAAQRKYDVLICVSDLDDTEQLEKLLVHGKADGVIFSQAFSHDSRLDMVRECHIPFVVMGRLEDATVLQTDCDHMAASYEMVKLLLQMGMRKIAYMGGDRKQIVNEDRLQGYLQALKNSRIELDKELIRCGLCTIYQRQDGLEEILEQHPECILCSDDNMAFFVLKELRLRHLSVPGDIQVASLYDSEILSDVAPSVTAVQTDAYSLGSVACRMLLDAIVGKNVPMQQIQGYQIILRESTKYFQVSDERLRSTD